MHPDQRFELPQVNRHLHSVWPGGRQLRRWSDGLSVRHRPRLCARQRLSERKLRLQRRQRLQRLLQRFGQVLSNPDPIFLRASRDLRELPRRSLRQRNDRAVLGLQHELQHLLHRRHLRLSRDNSQLGLSTVCSEPEPFEGRVRDLRHREVEPVSPDHAQLRVR